MGPQLTGGAIEGIMSGTQVDNPVFQVLGLKKIAGSGGQGADRYRLLLSDGQHSHSSAMLATQLNEKVDNGEISQFAVILLNKYLCNPIQPDRRVMIILDVTVVTPGSSVGEKLGNPTPFKPGSSTGGGAAAPAQQQQAAPPAQPKPASNPVPLQQQNGQSSGRSFYNKPATPVQNRGYGGGGGGGNAPSTPGGTPAKVHPISSLTPYQNRWTIRARVTSKSAIRTWSNSRGEGKLFSFNLLDESGEIRATAFTSEVDKFYDLIDVNKVFYLSKAQLKTANKQYSNLDNDYEMTLSSQTEITPCQEETNLPTIQYNFVPISQMDQQQPNTIVDVVGVARGATDVSTIITKATQKELRKREVHLVDENKVQINLTLWGNDAEKFEADNNPIVAIKGCRVSDFGGRSLSSISATTITLNPDIPEAHKLRGWFDSVGHAENFEEYRRDGGGQGSMGAGTNWKTLAQVKSENIGQEKADYFTAKATIVFLRKENCMYMACPSPEGCNKKVIDQANGSYRCEKCNKEYTSFKWRMILSANVADFGDNQWVTCFQDSAEGILGKTSEEIGNLRDQNEMAFDLMFQEATFKSFIFKMRAKMETYNDENRLKTVVVSAQPVNFQEYNTHLLADIERLLAA